MTSKQFEIACIRVGVLGDTWVIKIKTQGQYCHGWTVFEKGFKNREEAIERLRELIASGKYEEG